jgi:hypothetical protein
LSSKIEAAFHEKNGQAVALSNGWGSKKGIVRRTARQNCPQPPAGRCGQLIMHSVFRGVYKFVMRE